MKNELDLTLKDMILSNAVIFCIMENMSDEEMMEYLKF